MIDAGKLKALIVDLDGTLYFQFPVRLCMLCSIVFFCLTHPFKIKHIKLVRSYRRMYAKGIDHSERCLALSKEFDLDINQTEDIIQKWMIHKPLRSVRRFRDKNLIKLLADKKNRGYKIIVYSDYPVTEKLKALDFTPCAAYAAEDVGCLKPSPEGLLHILSENELEAADCLFIGDKYDKDGKCAENAGMEYIILPQSKPGRKRVLLTQWGRFSLCSLV